MFLQKAAASTTRMNNSLFVTATLIGSRNPNTNFILPIQSLAAFSTKSRDWSFPKHREFMNEDYYRAGEERDSIYNENPYGR